MTSTSPNLLSWAREDVHEEDDDNNNDINVRAKWGEDCCQVFVDQITHFAKQEDRFTVATTMGVRNATENSLSRHQLDATGPYSSGGLPADLREQCRLVGSGQDRDRMLGI